MVDEPTADKSILGVVIDGFTNGADKKVRTIIALLRFVAVGFATTTGAIIAVAIWVFTVGATNDRQDLDIAATANAVTSLSETMHTVVAEQISLRRDVEHLREGDE